MHICYIHQHFSSRKGATGTRSYEMGQRLIAAGHRVTMICGASDVTSGSFGELRERVNEQEVDGIRVLVIAEPYANKMSFARRALAFARFANTATNLVKKVNADLVFATSTPLTVGIPGMKGSRSLRRPFVFEVRDLWPELPIAMGIVKNPLIKWYLRNLEKRIYHSAKHIIALAPGIRDGICRTGYPEAQTSLIPNAADLDLWQPSTDRTADPRFGSADELRLVFTGAHGMANGLDSVLDAAAVLKKRGEKGIRFVFIGQGKLRDALMERSRREGLDGLTTWIELMPKNELARLLPQFDVGMMILKNVPAFYYGTSPNKFFDYIASGLPVLNNYPGWLAGMIQRTGCGVVVPPDDAHAFADACIRLRERLGELKAMGLRGRKLAEEEFSRDKLGAQFVRTLEAAAKR